MSTYKNTSGDYYVNVAAGTGTLFLSGNLNVQGNVTYIDVNELVVEDPFITVAGNNTGNLATATFQSQGLVAQTSSTTYAGIRFNNTANAWQISNSVNADGSEITPYATLASGGAGIPGGANTNIQINDGAGGFLGNANFSFDFTTSKLTLNGHQVLGNIGSAPSAVANSVTIYNNAPGAGATGLYTVGITTTADEVISLTRARLYAIIF